MAATLALTTSAPAAILTYDLNIEYSGATPPAGPAPWISATFDDGGGSGTVTMTLTTPNLVSQEFVRFWHFNLDPSLNPASLLFSAPTKVGSFTDPIVNLGVDAYQAGGDGLYDILIEFDNAPPGDRFGAGDSVTYTITGIPTLTANSFNFLSTPAGGNGPFNVAAHVQGIGSNGDFSGWITQVPEPTALSLLALGSLATLRRRRQ
jgi:hypothetical protein